MTSLLVAVVGVGMKVCGGLGAGVLLGKQGHLSLPVNIVSSWSGRILSSTCILAVTF